MDNDTQRGTGRTTEQLKNAPTNSTFIWCTGDTDYPRRLQQKIGRGDIRVMGISSLMHVRDFVGLGEGMVVIDHAASLDNWKDQVERLRALRVLAL